MVASHREESTMKILIADTDRVAAEALSDIVSDQGLTPVAAHNANQAILMMSNAEVSVAIVDAELRLPDGEALVGYMKTHWPELLLIATSRDGSWQTSQRVRVDHGPVFFYALKPLDLSEVREALLCAAAECHRRRARALLV